MTERQRKVALAMARLKLVLDAVAIGESKISKVQSRNLTPAVIDIITKQEFMVKAASIMQVDLHALLDQCVTIGFLKSASSADFVIKEDERKEEVEDDDESTRISEEFDRSTL